jgi:hypothetical protein
MKYPRLYVLLKINTCTAPVFTTLQWQCSRRILLRLFLDLKACWRMIDSPRLILNIQEELKKGILGQCNELLNFGNLKTEWVIFGSFNIPLAISGYSLKKKKAMLA